MSFNQNHNLQGFSNKKQLNFWEDFSPNYWNFSNLSISVDKKPQSNEGNSFDWFIRYI